MPATTGAVFDLWTLWQRIPLDWAPCPACSAKHGRPLCTHCRELSLMLPEPATAALGAHALHFVGAYAQTGGPTPLGRALRAFKDAGDRYAGRCLSELFAARTAPLVADADAVVPVPSDPRRLRERGFHPAAWLARELSARSGVALRARTLRRFPGRPPQRGLSGAARRRNVSGAFELGRGLPHGYSIALVDDVVTTGATLLDASRCLRLAGAGRVVCLALACADEELIAACRSTTGTAGTPSTGMHRR